MTSKTALIPHYFDDRIDIINALIDGHNLAESTKLQYKKAIENVFKAGVNITNAEELAMYSQTLGKSSKAFLKSAIKLWSREMELKAKGQVKVENAVDVLVLTYQLEALNEAIKVEGTKGEKAHFWLSQSEVKRLLATCNTNLEIGKRDKIVLGVLVGAGLRRNELVNLTFDNVKQQGDRTVLEVSGKGDKGRVVPISDNLAKAIDDWQAMVGDGHIARAVAKGGIIRDSISAIGIFNIVNKAGKAIGKNELAPHDLRRTYAQIGFDAGVPITQISKLLGHSSVTTTQRYLNLELDLETTISDFVPF